MRRNPSRVRLRMLTKRRISTNRDMQKGTFRPYPLTRYVILGGGIC